MRKAMIIYVADALGVVYFDQRMHAWAFILSHFYLFHTLEGIAGTKAADIIVSQKSSNGE